MLIFQNTKVKFTGSFGDVACWSLQGNKLISGGEGGILLTDNQDIYERAVLLGHNLKRPAISVKNKYYDGLERTGFGLKLRMHPLAAVIVLHQLNNYGFDWIKTRNDTLIYFEDQLETETFFKGMSKRDYVTSMGAWYGFYPIADFNQLGIDRNDFVTWMQKRNFQAKIPKSKILSTYKIFNSDKFKINNFDKHKIDESFPGAQKYFSRIVSFPTFTFSEHNIIDEYVSSIKKYYKENK